VAREARVYLALYALVAVLATPARADALIWDAIMYVPNRVLDLLDTQNTRVASQIAVETASAAVQFAEFRILASTGTLLKTMGVKRPSAAEAYARKAHDVPETPPAETQRRHSPRRSFGAQAQPLN